MGFPQLRESLSRSVFKTSSPVAYTLTCDSGAYAISGTDAGLRAGRYLAADAGSYAWTGTAATLKYGYVLLANAGAYSWVGTDASLTYGALAVNSSLSTTDLKRRNYPRAFHPSHQKPFRFAVAGAYTLTADPGAVTWTGSDAGLIFSAASIMAANFKRRNSSAWPRPFAPTTFGQLRSDRDRIFPQDVFGQPGVQTYFLGADPGNFDITGIDVNLSWLHILTASEGAVVIASVVNTLYGRVLQANTGAFTITGTAALADYSLAATSGSFLIGGASANLIYSGAPPSSTGSLLLLGVG